MQTDERDPEDIIEQAIQLLLDYGSIDGAHHKMWTIDQALRILAGPHYEAIIRAWEYPEGNEQVYEWETGIAP
jgi:hypothetical protein